MVASLSRLLLVVQYAVVHHGVEAVDDAGPADEALKLRLDTVPHLFAFGAFTDLIQRCWAHLLMEARYLAEHVEEARPFSEALHRLYGGLRCWAVDKPPPGEAEGLAGEARKVMMDLVGRPYESEEARRFAGKVLNGMDHWFTFLVVPGVEPTNNRAERALREHVVQRKIMGCFRNGKGTWIYETVMTVLSTWKQQGRDLPQALGDTLTQEWINS